MDESIFTEDLLRAFVKLTPQKTDIEMLAPFKDLSPEAKLELGDADQFFLEIMFVFSLVFFSMRFLSFYLSSFSFRDIPRLESRISAFLFKKTFEVLYVSLSSQTKPKKNNLTLQLK